MTFIIEQEGMNFLLYSEVGPFASHMRQRGRSLQQKTEAASHAGHPAHPDQRSGVLTASINFPGLVRDEVSGGFKVQVGTGATSPRQSFNYPLALEIGMPAYAPLSISRFTGLEQAHYHYPFLRPALEEEISQVG